MNKFEIESCVKWIEDNNFHTIALQVPDDDLDKIQDLIDLLTSSIHDRQIEIFLVGDGCSPCCNDLLNAQYCNAQGLIHFGHSCLSSSSDDNQQTTPIFYVFYQRSLPDDASNFLLTNQDNSKPYCLVFYDPCFRDAIEQHTPSSRFLFSKISSPHSTDPLHFSLYGRSVNIPVPLDPSNYSIVFISHSKASLHNFALHFYAYDFRSFPSDSSISAKKLLSKRMYAIECARNASSFGLLTSSNSLLNLPTTILTLLDHIKKLFDQHNRQYYTYLMNTLSIAKMNNFERTVDVYVLCSSCTESIWLSPDYKQFNIPLISINDILHAFAKDDDSLSLNYLFDLRQILKILKPIDENEKNENEENNSLILKNPNALLLQQRDGANRGLDGSHAWWGLQITENINEEQINQPISELKEGKSGIAAGYTNEKF
ncbi:unnamed protein product [Rotaria socialis]|uniref:2-(3-amino-3-carboxypropyl)histidine synthase subunit 2 n=2 Tax=Rotaria socialis TaxID=392032 RepID=A0A817TKU4_9BILA|nr:unnamed protein product [Rotaria socialis]CAF4475788.1 unnamed protein product [Rotaria socialis]